MSILYLFLFLTFSLTYLFLVRCFPCILPVYQVAPYAFLLNLISYLSKKKSWKKSGTSIINLEYAQTLFSKDKLYCIGTKQ
jgi:hypothetical protein